VANSESLATSAHSDPAPRARAASIARDLVALTKPRITALVLLTETAGMCLAPGHVPASTRLLAWLGTALVVASANALNMWWERDVDARMSRTRNRPLPAGRLSPDVALAFGLGLGAAAVPMLFLVNPITGLLGLVSLVTYVAIYTPLKRYTYLALLVGAVPGAMPPLLGWTAVEGKLGAGGLLLFAFLFVWQVPHFAAITLFRAEEYARAGLQVVSVQHGERGARVMIASWTALLVAVSLGFGPLGLASVTYQVVAALLGVAFLALALRGLRPSESFDVRRWGKRVFAFSIPYLVVLLLVLVDVR
jgi:protoheme IX farnesyltransferase